ncbi:MAG: uroporphyrinogen decarboxylase family protein [Eubacteriales bacterium]|nr:uroporphyrinogen decarboxylase family protein [Eubacteriales bacterium]
MENKRQRMKKALNNEAIDGILCSVWRHLPEEKRKGDYVIQDQIRYYRETDVDFVKIMSDGYFEYPLSREIQRASDWRYLEPLPENHPYFTDQEERAKQIVEEIGGECMVYYNIFAAFSSMRFAATDGLVMRHLKEDEEAVLYALDVIAGDNARLAEKIIRQCGCDGVYFCVQGGEKKRFSHEEYMRLVSPSDLRTLTAANQFSEWNLMHCCGWDGFENHLENWKDYPCRAVNWSVNVEKMSLEDGKKFFGGKAVIGGMDNTKESVIHKGSPEEIDRYVRKLAEKYRNMSGFLLGADCSFHSDIPLANISRLMETVHQM